jgi:hypothetical protein
MAVYETTVKNHEHLPLWEAYKIEAHSAACTLNVKCLMYK